MLGTCWGKVVRDAQSAVNSVFSTADSLGSIVCQSFLASLPHSKLSSPSSISSCCQLVSPAFTKLRSSPLVFSSISSSYMCHLYSPPMIHLFLIQQPIN